MGYTKDIVLDIRYLEEKKDKQFWTSKFKNNIKNNKLILYIVGITLIFMIFDVVLINSFIQLLSCI